MRGSIRACPMASSRGRAFMRPQCRGMKRCRAEGAERFALFVGAAVLANNLMIVAGIKAAASHHVASHNFAWQTPIHARKRRDKNW
jgi:hypothetical protein